MSKFYYHATYQPHLESIRKHGLQGGHQKAWQDSKDDVVYLATSAEVAESYAETSELVEDNGDYFDQIVVLKISASDLDESLLSLDENVLHDEALFSSENYEDATLEYHGVIPASALSILNALDNTYEPLVQPREVKLSKFNSVKAF